MGPIPAWPERWHLHRIQGSLFEDEVRKKVAFYMPKGEAPLKEPHCHQLDLQLPVLRIKENKDFPFRNHQPEGLHYDSKLVHPTCPYYPSRVSVSTST